MKTKVFGDGTTVEDLNKFLENKINVQIYHETLGMRLITVVNYEE